MGVMDTILIWTLTMIFLAAVIGLVIRYRSRDKCLGSLEKDFVVLEWPGGKQAWGVLGVFHNAIELVYPTPHPNPAGGHDRTSFILYKPQYPEVYAFKRYHDELSDEAKAKRKKEIDRTYHPNLFRRMRRRIRNLFNLLRDALAQSLGAFIGSAKKSTQSVLLQSQDARLTETAKTLIMASPDAYEPILEQYIGRKVVVEVTHDGVVTEYCGILKEYSEGFLSVLDVSLDEESLFDLAEPERLRIHHDLDFEVRETGSSAEGCADFTVRIVNRGGSPVTVVRAEGDGQVRTYDRHLPPGEEITIDLPHTLLLEAAGEVSQPRLNLVIRGPRSVDLVVHRTRSTIRHGAEALPRKRFRLV